MAPLLQSHYTTFIATTGHSVPVTRIGTLALVGLPLELLPWHRDDRFSSSKYEPESDSRRLNAERHAGSKQVSPALIPGRLHFPVLTLTMCFDASSTVRLRSSFRLLPDTSCVPFP